MSHHPSVSDLVLPSQPSLSTLLATLKKQNLSPHNRLRSILRDAAFVASASAALGGRPLVANERCGSWYVDPARKAGSAYFKSTDGHTGQWGFSCRRLNLHLLPLIEENDGWVFNHRVTFLFSEPPSTPCRLPHPPCFVSEGED